MDTPLTIKGQALTMSAVNGQIIRKRAKMTQDEYRMLFVDTGCEFIEHIYDLPNPKSYLIELKDAFLSNPEFKYWKWWMAEWINYENIVHLRMQTMSKYGDQREQITKLFKQMITSSMVYESFRNHIKTNNL